MGKTSDDLLAINVLVEPGRRMLDSATHYNKKLLGNYSGPGSFALDASHIPHITVLQCFVKEGDLPKIFNILHRAVKKHGISEMELTATGFSYIPYKALGVGWITVEAKKEMLSFQKDIIERLTPMMHPGNEDAFVQNPDHSSISKETIAYVNAFVEQHSGERYQPHVTLGLATRDYLDSLAKEPFHPFTFNVASISIYQLGDFGTARIKLWGFEEVTDL